MKSNVTGKASITIDAPATKVWEALTTPSIIKKYFFGTDAISDFQPGSPITFTGEYKGKTYEDKGHILEVIPQKILRYNYWSSMSGIEDKPENYVPITFALVESDDKTTVAVTQQNIPDEKMKEHSEENWRKVLNNLKELLERETMVVNH
jgi:uncharacterized protein YndB with AHSA1/START domain